MNIHPDASFIQNVRRTREWKEREERERDLLHHRHSQQTTSLAALWLPLSGLAPSLRTLSQRCPSGAPSVEPSIVVFGRSCGENSLFHPPRCILFFAVHVIGASSVLFWLAQ